ncbi:uncharacterized protein LOC123866441 [Maniola jurtina]|uniref:uncharacterized protein LOC123866441 n=1 Tax=Maniola jurtina TaxID=191418 RepID=UPI001E68BDD2|nr:uncharacterized protein LOC123866441 [Maniola jurtina]XP_045763972.1 uncharacterized protein LOC123866441 [Maniola jurtina]
MDQLMTREESYAERRRLFKDIWETSMNMDDKEDIMTKPKVIKTLRLSEVDRCVAKKKKKQKLKNLRAVCNKLLDFCDRQDADDLFYEQMAVQSYRPSTCSHPTEEPKIKTKKPLKVKRKTRKTKSLSMPDTDVMSARGITSERKAALKKKTRHISPVKVKRTSFATSKILEIKPILPRNSVMSRPKAVVKKKRSKKKSSDLTMPKDIKYDDLSYLH